MGLRYNPIDLPRNTVEIIFSFPRSHIYRVGIEQWREVARALDEDLAEVFDSSVVKASMYPLGSGTSTRFDLSVRIRNAAELDDPVSKDALVNDVIEVVQQSLLNNVPDMGPRSFRVNVYESDR